MNRRSYNSNSNKNRTQARLARIRDKALKLRERVKRSVIAFHERRAARLTWWERAFRTPAIIGSRLLSRVSALWMAFLETLGLSAASSRPLAYQRPAHYRRAWMRGIMHEPLEDRRLLAVDITGNNLGDNIVNAQEQTMVQISGTATGGTTAVTVVIDDGAMGGAPVVTSASVSGGTWTTDMPVMNVSGLAEGSLTVQAIAQDGPASVDSDMITKDTVPPNVQLPFQITSDDVINIAESPAVTVAGTGAIPFGAVTLSVSDGAGFSDSRSLIADAAGDFDNSGAPFDVSSVADGATLTFTAVSADLAGNVGTDSRTATTDFTAPAPPTILTPTAGQAFNATSGQTVTVSGIGAIPNGAVAISATDGSSQVITPGTLADGSGNFTLDIDITSLTDGNVTILVSSVDSAGNPGTSQVIVDLNTTAPAIDLLGTGGVQGDINAANATTYVVDGTSDEIGGLVTITLEDALMSTVTATATVDAMGNYTATVNASPLSDGSITITASVTDSTSNTGTATTTVSKDASAPNLAIDVPAGSAVNIAEGNPFDFTITGADPMGTVNYTIDDGTTTISGSGTADASGELAVGPLDLITSFAPSTSGSFTITAGSTDMAGNTGAATSSHTYDFVAPGVPAITSVADDGGTLTPGALTNDTTLAIIGTAPEAGTIQIVDSANPTVVLGSGTTSGSGPYTFSVTTSTLVDGTYNFQAQLLDAAGNVSPLSGANGPYTVDTSIPGVTIDTPIAGSDNTANAVESASLTVTGTVTGATSVALTFLDSSSSVPATATVAAGVWTATVDITSLADGTILLLATATDGAGNSFSTTTMFTKDATAPNPVIATPIMGDNIVNQAESSAVVINGSGAEPGESVIINIYDDTSTLVATNTVTANGSGGFTDTFDLSAVGVDGSWTVEAKATDAAGNEGTDSAPFTVDRVIGTPTINTPIEVNDIVDASEVTSVELDGGNAEPNRTVTVVFNDSGMGSGSTPSVTQTVTADMMGDFELSEMAGTDVDLSGLLDGTITVTATTTDVAGNTASVLHTFIKDTVGPVITIAPVAGDDLINAMEIGNVVVAGTYTDATGVDTMTPFDVAFPGIMGTTPAPLTGSPTAGSFATAAVDLSTLPDGSLVITVTGSDAQGNTSSATRTVTIDANPPVLTIDTPIAGDGVINSSEASAVTVTGTVDHPTGTVVVTFTDGVNPPVVVPSIAVAGDFSVTADLSGLNDGLITITASSTDASNNTGTATASATKDTVAPAIMITPPVSPYINQSNVAAYDITGTGAEAGEDVTVVFSDGTTSVSETVTADGSGNFSLSPMNLADLTPLAQGGVTVTASTSDTAGNSASDTIALIKDTAAPNLTLDTVAGDDIINEDEATDMAGVDVSGSGADPFGAINLNIPGLTIPAFAADASGDFTITLTPAQVAMLAEGTLTITASTTDLAGNTGTAMPKDVTVDRVDPTITLNAAADSDVSASESTSVPISGTVNDPSPNAGSLVGSTVTIVIKDVDNTPATPDITATATVVDDMGTLKFSTTVDISSLNDGDINIDSATITDAAGNEGETDAKPYVTLDSEAPDAPVIDTANGSTSGALINDATPLFAGTREDAGDSVEIFRDGTSLGMAVGAGTTWTFTPSSPLPDGSAVYTAVSTDAAGNVSTTSAPFTLTIDTVAPPLALNTPITPDNVVNASESLALVISGVGADPGRPVVIEVVDSAMTSISMTVTSDASGNYSSTFNISSLLDGTINVNASSDDPAGNVGADSTTFSKMTAAPAVMITGSIEGDDIVNAGEAPDVEVGGTGAAPNRPVVVSFTDSSTPTPQTVSRTVIADGSGNFTIASNPADLTGLMDGTVTVTATSFDQFGNVGVDTRTILLDTVAPAVSIDTPISMDDFVNASEAAGFEFTVSGFDSATVIDVTFTDSKTPTANTEMTTGPTTGMSAGTVTFNLATSSLIDGAIIIEIENTDAAGNTGTDTATFTLDTVVPALTIDTPIAGDDIVNSSEQSAVVVSGDGAEPGDTVTVTFTDGAMPTANTVTASATANAMGEYTVTADISSLDEGAITVDAETVDVAGNVGSATTAITKDTEIDQVTIDDPVEGDNVINASEVNSVIVSGGGAADMMLSQQVTVVFADEDPMTADVTRVVSSIAPAGSWSLASNVAGLSGLTDTPNLLITVTTEDGAGNVSTATKTVELNANPPVVTIGIDDFINESEDGAVVVSGTTDGPDDVIVTLTNGSQTRTATVTPVGGNYSATFDLDAMPVFDNGALTATATTTDSSGNVGTATANSFLDTVKPDKPGVTVSDDNGVVPDDSATNDNTLTIEVDPVTDPAPSSLIASVEILDGSTVLGAATLNMGVWEFDTGMLADGDYNFRARVTDNAGNVSTLSDDDAANVTIDTAVPMVTIDTPISGDNFVNAAESGSDLVITGTTTEANAPVTVTFVDSASTAIGKVVMSDGSGNYSVTLTVANIAALVDGSVTVLAESTDSAGNTGTDTQLFTLDRVAPMLSVTSPLAGSFVNGTVTVQGTGADAGAAVDVSITDGTTTVSDSNNADMGGTFVVAGIDVSSLAQGPIDITVTSSDAAGNSDTEMLTVILDSQIGTPTIDTIAGDDVVDPSEQSAVDVTGGNAEPNRPVTVTFTDSVSGTVTAVGSADAMGDYSLNTPADLSGLADGDITVVVETSDTAGNTASASKTIVKDTAAPVITTNTLTAAQSTQTVITSASLSSVDNVSPPSDVTYTVTTAPTKGYIALVSAAGTPITSFTQEQVDNNEVVFVSTSGVGADSLAFDVSDAAGNSASDTLDIDVIVANLPNVESVTFEGDPQRSTVRSMTITFDQLMTGVTNPGAISVIKRQDPGDPLFGPLTGVNVSLADVGGKTVATLTFTPGTPFVDASGNLLNGNYQLEINANLVKSVAGGFLLDGDNNGIMGDDFIFGEVANDNFFKLFGDGDGDGDVDLDDLASFRTAFLGAYDPAFDVDDDGDIDLDDLAAFREAFTVNNTRPLGGF